MELTTVADSVRLLALPAVAWGAYTDYTRLLVHNTVWKVVAAVGLLALGIDAYAAGGVQPVTHAAYHLVWAGIFATVMIAGNSGLADVYAVLALAIWIPRAPFGLETSVVYPVVVLTAAVLLAGAWQLGRDKPGVPFIVPYAVAVTAGLGVPALLYVGGGL